MSSWQSRAACRDLKLAGLNHIQSEAALKERCAVCPVRGECLAEALVTPDTSGVWGGLTRTEREGLLRRERMAS